MSYELSEGYSLGYLMSEPDDAILQDIERVLSKEIWVKSNIAYFVGKLLIYLVKARNFTELNKRLTDLLSTIFED